jgi:hypothetical protein
MENEFNLINIFEERKWKSALFLTYALSLTFFETIILRKLQNVGCEEIWIVPDADGYQMSLSERKSAYVGQEYRVVPVILKNGIFHPKCVYLSSEDGDLLIIGSGNLTFGGYGKNLEVAEILEPEKTPQAFIDFGVFLDNLPERNDLKIPETNWISKFSTFSKAAVKNININSAENVRVISTVKKNIISQLLDNCNSLGEINKIYSLSPFYSNDAEFIRMFSEETSAESVSISLAPDNLNASPFPFKKTINWKTKVTAVVPDFNSKESEHRKLHAKWIECHGHNNKKIILTGSINSTNTAMLTTNNIEVGVLRTDVDKNKWINWKKTKIPSEQNKNIYPEKMGQNRCIVYANLHETSISGYIIHRDNVSGEWQAILVKPDGENINFCVWVDESGFFKETLPQIENFSYASSLQIQLNKNGIVGRGWINQENVLRISSQNRLNIISWHRIINNESTDDDEIALLHYLSIHADEHLKVFNSAIKTSNVKKSDDSDNIYVNVELLKPETGAQESQPISSHQNLYKEEGLDRVLSQLRKKFMGHNNKKNIPHVVALDKLDDEADGDNSQEDNSKLLKGLKKFDQAMRSMLTPSLSNKSRTAILSIYLEVTLNMLISRLNDIDSALDFINQWFNYACQNSRLERDITSLEQHAYATAAIISYRTLKSNVLSSFDQYQELQLIHDKLECFMGEEIIETNSIDRLEELYYIPALTNEKYEIVVESFAKMLSHKTIRTELCEVLDSINNSESICNFPRAHNECWSKLFSLIKQKKKIIYKECYPDNSACPHDNILLPNSEQSNLAKHRLAICPSCGKFIVRTKL